MNDLPRLSLVGNLTTVRRNLLPGSLTTPGYQTQGCLSLNCQQLITISKQPINFILTPLKWIWWGDSYAPFMNLARFNPLKIISMDNLESLTVSIIHTIYDLTEALNIQRSTLLPWSAKCYKSGSPATTAPLYLSLNSNFKPTAAVLSKWHLAEIFHTLEQTTTPCIIYNWVNTVCQCDR